MGNSGGKTDTGKAYGDGNSFSRDEVKALETLFLEISSQSPDPKGKRYISKDLLIKKFPENTELAEKVFKWLQKVSDKSDVEFSDFLSAVEVLAKDPMQYQNAHFKTRSFEKYEVFLQISTENYIGSKDTLSESSVTKEQGFQFVKEVLRMFHSQILPDEHNIERAANVVIEGFFKEDETSISWRDMLYYIKQTFIYLNKAVKFYFAGKFVERALPLKLPILEENSSILNKELLGVFYLSNSFFHSVPRMQLLYSTSKSGTSFNRLAYSLKGYDAPTLILCKHVEKDESSKIIHQGPQIFGGFARAGWYDELKYNGDSESYVFSLAPKFKSFYAYRGQGGTNYMYLNTRKIQQSKYKVGLGFGGLSHSHHRLWLDEELETGSYASPDDNTYDKGYLVDPLVNHFNVEQIEIWGLGDQSTLQGQLEFRKREMDLIESQRKVDKKAFLSGFDKELFFANTFKTSERADQTDFKAEMEKMEQDEATLKNQ